jgi:chromate reductase, NAD(P)H dehydrogenase (quinone)
MLILGISGSLRRDSHNSALLRTTASLLPDGVEIAIYDDLGSIPPFNEDAIDPRPATVGRLEEAVASADGLLIATPEFNSSIPGVLKNALDWMSFPLESSPIRNKPTAVIGASTGMFGAVWAQDETRKVMSAIGARVVDVQLPVPTVHELPSEAGLLKDEDLERQLRESLSALVAAIHERAAFMAVAA